jgi:flagellar M-ring protein FliF
MEFLNRAYSQLQGVYRSMPPSSRLTAGALAAIVLLSLGYLGLHQNAETSVDLVRGMSLSAGQIAAIEEAFSKANLKGHEIRENSIRVPRERQAEFASALADAKVLNQDFGDAQLDAVNGGSFIEIGTNRDQERMRIGKQNKLQQSILERPGITYAKVIFDVDPKPVGFKDKVMTALVSIKRGDGSQIDEATISAVNGMVVHAYAGLKPENVAVSDLNGRTWYGDPMKNANAEGTTYLSLKRTCEQDLKAKILDALGHIPNVTVGVNVELDRKLTAAAKQVQPSAAPGDHRIENNEQARSNSQENRIGPPEASSQQPNVVKVLDALLGDSPSKEGAIPSAPSTVKASVPEEQVERAGFALAPISARVSVGVPASYFKSVWQRRHPAESGHPEETPDQAELDRICIEETANIQRSIAPLLPPSKGAANAVELVTVTTFNDPPAHEPPRPELAQIALDWLARYGNTVALIGLALVCLLMVRSIVRGAASAAGVKTAPAIAETDDEPLPEEQADVPAAHWKQHFRSAGPSLREEISEFVEEDPETAANILRNWIGQAG